MLVLVILYSTCSILVNNKIVKKDEEAISIINDTNSKITAINQNIKSVNEKANDYVQFIEKLNAANQERNEYNANKNAIPILLKNIQSVIPDDVQLLSIKNTTNKHIQIKTQAEKYEQIGMFIAKLKNDGILLNITSDTGTRNENILTVTIEGDLPTL